ncbi:MAG: DUF1800 domain-containing protein [Chitinophagales bacterium]
MNRREALKKVIPIAKHNYIKPNNTLMPYTGNWTFSEAAHLLRRTIYGPTFHQIKTATENGLAATISQLFIVQDLPEPPIYYDFSDDPNVPNGQTWVDNLLMGGGNIINQSRKRSLYAWMFGLMNEGGISIREKMVLFWHNHFVASSINQTQYLYDYIQTIRQHALGNFRTLAEEISISPAMLEYLNGNTNIKDAPNENYARELLELFTIGKGELAGEGDYTHFTEQDVIAIARAFTGWRSIDWENPEIIAGFYEAEQHDTTAKQLSHRFDYAIIENNDENEYKDVIDIILQQDETARFVCRQLHIWFVGSDISSDVEINVIAPMAQILRDNNYEVQPALQALLQSEYFFQESLRACMIAHPIDFIFKMVNSLHIVMPTNLLKRYQCWRNLNKKAIKDGMSLFILPNVAGWKAFYQEPLYYKYWINSASLLIRNAFVNQFMNGITVGGHLLKIDALAVIAQLDNPSEPNELIEQLSQILFAFPISQEQKDILKNILIPGLPDFEWTVEYSDYLANPDDIAKENAIRTKLEAMFLFLLKMPEMQLI